MAHEENAKGPEGSDKPVRRDLGDRLLQYAVGVVRLAEKLSRTFACKHVRNQLLRCGTSSGANYEEAQGAESRTDFVHKLQIALKEMRESNYWLRLIAASGMLPESAVAMLLDESSQLRAILSKSVATAKGQRPKPRRPEPEA